jgi:protein phosphatase
MASGKTDVGNLRAMNEDGFLISSLAANKEPEVEVTERYELEDKLVLLVVADGCGGEEAGTLAPELIYECLLEEISADVHRIGLSDALRVAVERANTKLFNHIRSNQVKSIGATVTVALIDEEFVNIAQVGDTRAYLLRGEQFVQVTSDQTLIRQLVRHGQITEEEAKIHTYTNVLVQALGAMPDVQVGLTQLRLKQDDRLLLCSDGLWRELSDQEIEEVVSESPVEIACEQLIGRACQKGGKDNLTVIVAEAAGESLPEVTESEIPTQMFTVLKELEFNPGISNPVD